MGEKSHLPEDNDIKEKNQNNSNYDDEEYDIDDTEEFQILDKQLDALNSALDNIEQKNASIHAQLLQLLQSNREIRKQLQEDNALSTIANLALNEEAADTSTL